ncbi:hypothetical protein SEVIR_1G278466v4 [Setaria viridis]|uniref:Uncharacterized protein n=1 Tax=Setaria viridis TaxID=4556 RepID=A0A4U6WFV4_SETVI|nr:hypothetical protein SEVIR_1G278466v2 [Setaria viridis]
MRPPTMLRWATVALVATLLAATPATAFYLRGGSRQPDPACRVRLFVGSCLCLSS